MPGHRIVVIGGGTAGITVAARLVRAGQDDVAVVEPSERHYYQPLWTLVGAGCARASSTVRPEASVMPRDVHWIHDAAVGVDPDAQVVHTAGGSPVGYDHLVVAPGIQLDWDRTPGLTETLGRRGVSSNYRFDLAPRTWDFVRTLRRGTAVFTMPSGPIKCAGAPQKIAYLASDHWRRTGVLDDIDVHLVIPGKRIFGLSEYADVLDAVIDRYGITLHTESEMTEIDPEGRRAVITDHGAGGTTFDLPYDLLHAVPRQSAPDWVEESPLAGAEEGGWVDVDMHTLQHVRWPNVFALGDAAGTPNAKTGAAVRKQAPVLVENLLATMAGRPPAAQYNGYGSCPIVTAKGKMVLAEFDYSGRHTPSIPVIDLVRERTDMWFLKKYGLPFLYWHLMLRGLA